MHRPSPPSLGTADAGLAAALLGAALTGLVAIRTQGLWDGHRSSRPLARTGRPRPHSRRHRRRCTAARPPVRVRRCPLAAAAGIAVAGLVLARRLALGLAHVGRRQPQPGPLRPAHARVGTDRRAAELVRLGEVHPEAGAEYVGVVGNRFEAETAGIAHLWVGEIADCIEVLDASPAIDRVVVCAGAVGSLDLATLLDREQQGGPEVVVHAGLPGIDASRITSRPSPTRRCCASPRPRRRSPAALVKRAFDIVVAGALLLVAAPVFALVAILVKREDGGPVLFRQERVGRDGVGFGMVKFRTMVVDAEARLAAMQDDNQRSGPLFKLAVDPRVTRIGHILRRTSLDELPQLLNVLKGEMSLVGPRPALQREVDEFPAELHARHQVRPGITGLWQVEARDNPAFDAYQRLDLFYVANTSFVLDVVVLLATAEQMLLRPFQSRRRGEMVGSPATADAPSFIAAA